MLKKTNNLHFELVTILFGTRDTEVSLSLDDITPDMRISDLLLYLETETDYLIVQRGVVREDDETVRKGFDYL